VRFFPFDHPQGAILPAVAGLHENTGGHRGATARVNGASAGARVQTRGSHGASVG